MGPDRCWGFPWLGIPATKDFILKLWALPLKLQLSGYFIIAMDKVGHVCIESMKLWKRQPEHEELKRNSQSEESENGPIVALFDKGVLVFSLTKQCMKMLDVNEIANILKLVLFIKEKYNV